MEELEVFLSSHSLIKKAAFLVEDSEDSSVERMISVFSYTSLNECCIVFLNPFSKIEYFKENIERRAFDSIIDFPENISYKLFNEFDGMDGDWALCPVVVGARYVNKLKYLFPKWIAGSIFADDTNSFKIWNTARDFCNNILLKTIREGKPPLVMDWEKDTENDIELSVIFPVFNVSEYLEKCIYTVTAWDVKYVEFLFVDDGSTDDSAEIIKKWMDHDSRIKLLQKENGGCASARQFGLDMAKGRYVGFVDPDDFIDPDMFRRILSKALSGSFDISLCGYNEYYNNSGKTKPAEDYITQPFLDGCFYQPMIQELIAYSRVAIWRGIYRREFLSDNNIGFYTELRRFDDLPFKVETFAFAKSVIMTNEYLYYYRLDREGQDVSADDERLYVHFDIFRHLDKTIGETYIQKLIDNLQMCKIQTHRYALSKIKPEYRNEYIKRAKGDLNSLCSYERTYSIAERMLGGEAAKEYRRILNISI